MSKPKISIDVNEAIEQISAKIGVATTGIIPEYTKLEFVRGISWAIGGYLLMTIPWLLFLVKPESWDTGAINLFLGIKLLFCVITTWIGGAIVFDNIEGIITPKALAIERLLIQITDIGGSE